jgi:hypothetical protein
MGMSESNLEDRAAIHDLFTRYCCALDNGEVEAVVDCVTVDAILKSPVIDISGRDEIRAFSGRHEVGRSTRYDRHGRTRQYRDQSGAIRVYFRQWPAGMPLTPRGTSAPSGSSNESHHMPALKGAGICQAPSAQFGERRPS